MKRITKILPVIILSAVMLTGCDNNEGPFSRRMENGHQVLYSGEKPAKGMITNTVDNLNNTVTKVSEMYVDKGLPAGDFKLYDTSGNLLAEGKGKWKNGMFDGEIVDYLMGSDNKSVVKGTFNLDSDALLDFEGSGGEVVEMEGTLYNGSCKRKSLSFNKKDGLIDGEYLVYVYGNSYPEGKPVSFLSEKGNYIAGKREGKYTYYSASDVVAKEENYKNGMLNGKTIIYDENGNIDKEIEYRDGKMNGLYIEYYPNGKIDNSVMFVDDVMNGPFKKYYESGQIEISSSVKNGNQDGVRVIFAENGNKISEETYVNGEPEGRYCEYDENGKKKVEGDRSNRHWNGLVTYYENGIPVKGIYYFHGMDSGDRVWYDKEGHKIKDYVWPNRTEYYPNGNKKNEGNYDRSGVRMDYYIEYYENGNKKYETLYDHDTRAPYDEVYYNEDGTVKSGK